MMDNTYKPILNRLVLYIVIIINSIVPLIIWPFGEDYFYYPKIVLIYILIILEIIIVFILYKKNSIKLKFSTELIPLILFGVMIILSAAYSQYKGQAFWGRPFRHEGAVAYISYFVIAYFSFVCVNSIDDAKIIIKFIMVSASIISIYGICQYLGADILQRDEIRKDWSFTSFATLGNPNFLGSYLSLLFPIAVCLYLNSKNKIAKYTLLILNLLLFSALICTRTRSAWVGTVFSLFFIGIMFLKRIMNFKYKIIVILISLAALTYTLDTTHNGMISAKFNSLVADYNAIVNKDQYRSNIGSQRIFIWTRTMDYMFERPILGSGPDTFDKVFSMSSEEAVHHFGSSEVYVDKAHNEYLQILVTMGFPALIFYIIFLFMLFIKSNFTVFRKGNNLYTVSLFSGIIAYIVQGFFNISVVSVAPVYWSIIGILLGINNIKE